MQKILGLDIGSYSIKAVEIENTFKTYKVRAFHEVVVPEIDGLDPAAVGTTAVKQLFSEHDIEVDKTYTAIMGLLASSRVLSLQNVKRRNLGAVVQNELESQAPFALDDVVVDQQIIESQNGVSTILAVMARKDDVEAYLSSVRDLGIEPKVIDVDFLSFMNLMPFVNDSAPDSEPADDEYAGPQPASTVASVSQKYRLLIDIGHLKTSVVFFKGPRLLAARTIRLAGRHFTEFLQKTLDVSYGEAQRIKHAVSRIEYGNAPASHEKEGLVARCLGIIVSELVREIVRTVHSFSAQEKVDPECFSLVGGSSVIKGLSEYIAAALELPEIPLSFQSEKVQLESEDLERIPFLTQALAIGLRGVHSKTQSTINLRRGELALAGSYDVVVRQISNLSLIIGSLLVCLLASYMLRWYLYGKQIDTLRLDYRDSVRHTLKVEPSALKNIAAKSSWNLQDYSKKSTQLIEDEIREMDTAVNFLAERQTVVPLRVLEAVSKAIPKQIEVEEGGKKVSKDLTIDVLEFSVKGQTVVIEGETDSRASAETVESILKTLPVFQAIEPMQASAKIGSENKIIKFRVQATLKEGA